MDDQYCQDDDDLECQFGMLECIHESLKSLHRKLNNMAAGITDIDAALAAEDATLGNLATTLGNITAQAQANDDQITNLLKQIQAGQTPQDLTAQLTKIQAQNQAVIDANTSVSNAVAKVAASDVRTS